MEVWIFGIGYIACVRNRAEQITWFPSPNWCPTCRWTLTVKEYFKNGSCEFAVWVREKKRRKLCFETKDGYYPLESAAGNRKLKERQILDNSRPNHPDFQSQFWVGHVLFPTIHIIADCGFRNAVVDVRGVQLDWIYPETELAHPKNMFGNRFHFLWTN